MAIMGSQGGKSGLTVRGRLVRAMQEIDASGVTAYQWYNGGNGAPEYEVETTDGVQRSVGSREVAAYVTGHRDAYLGLVGQFRESYDNALSSPDVRNRETLLEAILADLEARCGTHLLEAADTLFGGVEHQPVAA